MCENYKYMLQIKPEFDIKYLKTGIRSQMIYLCEVKDVFNGNFKLNYDNKRFNLLVKECGKCHICRYKKASIKACQSQAEYKSVGKGSFITLTFGKEQMTNYIKNDKRFKNLSTYMKQKYINYLQWTLEKREFQLFIKRLRWKCYQDDLRDFSLKYGYKDNVFKADGTLRSKILKLDKYDYTDFKPRKIRYLHAGEYGELKSRPHHHAVIYGIDFSWDKNVVRWSYKQQKNVVLHFNNVLSDLWQFGDVTTDKVNYQTCNYVARYVTKKVVNKDKNYQNKDIAGSIYKGRLEEYCTQSNRNGLGYDYYMKNADKINKDLKLCFKNNKGELKYVPIPRYFKELMKRHFKSDFLRMQNLSIEKQLEFSNTSPDMLFERMKGDTYKGVYRSKKFIGDLERGPFSSELLNYQSIQLKKQVFDDLHTFKDMMLATSKDTPFVESEKWRITCYKNFEKYRKCLLSQALNKYVSNRYNYPNKSEQLLQLHRNRTVIKLLDNPFTIDNIDIYAKDDVDLRYKWLNFDRSKMYA